MKIKFSFLLIILFALSTPNLWAAAPRIVSSIPANDDLTADPNTPCIEVTFNEPMTGAGNWSFSSTSLTGQWSWSNDLKTFRYCRNNPQNPLATGSYWFKLNPAGHTGFKSSSTGELLPETTISFTVTADGHNDGPGNADVTPPQVTGSIPRNGAVQVAVNTSYLEVTFNEDMDMNITDAWESAGKAAIFWVDNGVGWLNSRTLRISRLSSNTNLTPGNYIFTLNPDGVQNPFADQAGNPLPKTTISFTVEGPANNGYTYYVPYFLSGSGYWTGLCVSNNSGLHAAGVTITLYRNSGTPYNNLVQAFEIVKNGQNIGVVAPGENASGWLKIDSTQKLSGSCFLGSSLMADIPFVSTLGKTLLVSQVAQDNHWDTKIMVCNPNNIQTSLTLTYYSKGGVATTSSVKNLPAWGGATYHLSDVFPNMVLDAGQVKLSVSQGGGIAAFALYYNTENGGSYFAGISADRIN